MAYKVISIHDIAQEFQESVENIEAELVNLIKQGKIPYKIDGFNKTIHKQVKNQKLASLKQVEIAGEHYLNDTETDLLRALLAKD